MSNSIKLKAAKDDALDISEGTYSNAMKVNADAAGPFVAAAFSNDTIGTTAEDGYLKINVGGTIYKIPAWLDD